MTVKSAGSLDLTTGMTLEAWVKPTAAQDGWRSIMVKERPDGLAYALYAFDDTDSALTQEEIQRDMNTPVH